MALLHVECLIQQVVSYRGLLMFVVIAWVYRDGGLMSPMLDG